MKDKYLLFWEKEIFVWHDREKTTFSLEAFLQNPPSGKAELLITDDQVQQVIITLPADKRLKLSQIMEHEALELVKAADLQELRENFIFNWRLLGEESGERVFLLLVLPKEKIVPLLETCRHKGLEIENIICSLDLLIKIGEHCSQKEEEFFLFSHKNAVYFIAFKHKKYVFHRKFELTQTDEAGLGEEFLLELKRSIFYVKQKYKLIPETLNILFLSPLLTEVLKKVKTELGLKEIKFWKEEKLPYSASEPQEISPFFILWLTYYHLIHELISLLPPEILLRKKIKNWALVATGIGLVLFFLSLFYLFKNVQEYKKQVEYLSTTLDQLIKIKKQAMANQQKFAYFRALQRQFELLGPFLEKRNFSYLYLETLPYLLPSKLHLEKLYWTVSLPTSDTPQKDALSSPHKELLLEGKVEVKDPQKCNQVFQKFVYNLKNCPFVIGISKEETSLLFKQGIFRLSVDLKEIKP